MRSTVTKDDRRPRRPELARRLVLPGMILACAAAAALASGSVTPEPAAAAKAPALIHSYRVLGVSCVPGPANTVRARVRVRMSVVNYDGWNDWADHMEAKGRLQPTTTGLNWTRSYRSWTSATLLQNHKYSYDVTINTDNVSGTAEWEVHLKLIWHRKAPTRNITVSLDRAFSTSCASTSGGGLPPAPAPPSAGAG